MLIRASVFNVYNEGVEKMSGDKGDESNEARAAKKEEVVTHQAPRLYCFACGTPPSTPLYVLLDRPLDDVLSSSLCRAPWAAIGV